MLGFRWIIADDFWSWESDWPHMLDERVHESFLPAYARAMSTKHVRSAADLVRFGAGLKIECARCGNSRILGGFELAKECGTASFSNIQQKLKCSSCGAKRATMQVLNSPPRR